MTQSFTMAQNFTSSVAKNVDPRTGQFKPTINFEQITANRGLGPHFPIALSYAPNNSANEGFGIGWTFAIANYNSTTGILTHPNGSNWIVDGEPDDQNFYKIKYQKIKDFRFIRNPDGYCIWNAHGDAIILGSNPYYSGDNAIYLPTHQINAAGYQLSFTYTSDGQLTDVIDGDGTKLVEVTYTTSTTTLTVYPDKDYKQVYKFNLENSYLESINYNTVERGSLEWIFETGTNKENPSYVMFGNNSALLSVTYPTGTRESVVYNILPYGLNIPGAGQMPSVAYYTSDYGAEQKPVKKSYTYSQNNYLGYNSGVNYTSQTDDELYNSPYNDYTYSVTEDVLDDNGMTAFSTKYTYNKYHLLNEEYYLDSSKNAKRTTTNTYDKSLFDGTPHDNLPSWFQNPLEISVTTAVLDEHSQEWKERTKKITREYYDSTTVWDGLIKTETYSDKKKVEHKYYKADGQETGCPLDPYVITNDENGWPSTYNKSIEVFDISGKEISVGSIEFDYITMSKKDNSYDYFPTQQFLMQSESRLISSGKLAIQKISKYCTDISSFDYTNIKSITTNSIIQGDKDDLDNGEVGLALVETYTYLYDSAASEMPDRIATTITKSGIENTTSKLTRCRFRGLVLDATDSSNNSYQYEYGTTGIATKEKYIPKDNFYKTTTNHTYDKVEINNNIYNKAISEITLDNPGNGKTNQLYIGQTHFLDGAGRTVRIDQAIKNNSSSELQYEVISDFIYNYFGEIDSVKSLDSLPGKTDMVNAVSESKHIYNTFQSLSGYLYPSNNGEREINSSFDPSTSTTTIVDNSIKDIKKKTVDLINKFVKEFVVDSTGNNIRHSNTYTFNEYGTLDKIVENITGNNAREGNQYEENFYYDYLARPTKIIIADKTFMELKYDKRFIQPRVTSITVGVNTEKKYVILECEYDDRSLLSKRSLYGRDLKYAHFYSYEYDKVFARLVSKTLPDRKTTISYDYEPSLRGKLKTITSSDGRIKNFTFDSLGNELTLEEKYKDKTQISISRTVDPIGRITHESYTTQGLPYASIDVSYSSNTSSVTKYTNANNIVTFNYYDDMMRLVRTENSTMRADFEYDKFSRLSSKKIWAMSTWDSTNNQGTVDSGSQTLTVYNYDDNTGELTRIWEKSVAQPATYIDMTYRSDGLLSTRSYSNSFDGSSIIRKEEFLYDRRKRLYNYSCTGTQLVTDSTGKEIQNQAYKYDVLNNIVAIITNYKGESRSITTTFNYRQDNPFLIDLIQKDGEKDVKLEYDTQFDRALNDDQGRQFTYDSFDRIATCTRNGKTTNFVYDATDNLRKQIDQDNNTRNFFYDGYGIDAEFTTDQSGKRTNAISRLYSSHGYLGQTGDQSNQFLSVPVDSLDTPIYQISKNRILSSGTTPFGDSDKVSVTAPSYRGEVYNEALGGYYLGRGYRLYNPRIGRFNKADNFAPHTAAGINPYGYAHNDPINYSDASGHLPQGKNHKFNWTGVIVVGAIVLILATAAITPMIFEGPSVLGVTKLATKLLPLMAGADLGYQASKNWSSNPRARNTDLILAFMVLSPVGSSVVGEMEARQAALTAKTERDAIESAADMRADRMMDRFDSIMKNQARSPDFMGDAAEGTTKQQKPLEETTPQEVKLRTPSTKTDNSSRHSGISRASTRPHGLQTDLNNDLVDLRDSYTGNERPLAAATAATETAGPLIRTGSQSSISSPVEGEKTSAETQNPLQAPEAPALPKPQGSSVKGGVVPDGSRPTSSQILDRLATLNQTPEALKLGIRR